MKNAAVRSLKPAGRVEPIATQPHQIPVEREDAAEDIVFVPVDAVLVAERQPFQNFLPLKEHRNAWARQHQRRPESRALLRFPTVRLPGMNVLREPALAVRRRHLVVRLAIDDALERSIVKAAPD